MLLSIHIKNFLLIDHLEMELPSGLNVLTGETGAGKSIVLGALQAALGGRAAPAEQIRVGADKMWLQAVFDIGGCGNTAGLLESQGVEIPEDRLLFLTRETTRSGRNVCRVNGRSVPLGFYRAVGNSLVDTHIQHEQHSLLDPARHLDLLDRFGGTELQELRQKVSELYHQWLEVGNKLERITNNAAERDRQTDLLRYAVDEIEQIAPKPGEDEELAAERRLLANGERICRLAGEAYGLLYDSGHNRPAVTDQLSAAGELLRNLAQLDESRVSLCQSLANAYYQIEEIAGELVGLRDFTEYEPHRLEAVEERIILLKNLKKKYAPTIPGVLEYLEQARIDLEAAEQNRQMTENAGADLENLEQAYRVAAESLSCCRQQAARRLEEEVSRSLVELEMGGVQCRVAIEKLTGLSAQGGERVEFLAALNPGEPLKPVAKTASGGELSRIMLALKALLAAADEVPVLILDEVDAGIGGKALNAVAEKLAGISQYHQILCVTHAPLIAGCAKTHYLVSKEFDGERTYTKIERLDHNRRIEEIARMLDGKETTDLSRQLAEQMLKGNA